MAESAGIFLPHFKSNETPLISIERVQFSCFECVCLLKQFSVAPAGTGEYSTKKRKKIGSLRIKELGNKSVWHFPGNFLLLKTPFFYNLLFTRIFTHDCWSVSESHAHTSVDHCVEADRGRLFCSRNVLSIILEKKLAS